MPHLHPTALIDETAQLAHDVDVGPFAIIGAGVVLEAGCRVEGHAQVLARSVIGEQCAVGHGTVIGGDPQSLNFDPALPSHVVLGKRNRLRENVTVHRSMYEGKATLLGNDNFLMAASHVGHDSTVGDHNVMANNVLLGGHVSVGHHTFLGGGSAFHQFIRVGDHAIAKGLSGWSMDLPPFCMGANFNQVFTLNVIGLKRAGFDSATRRTLKRAFDLIYRSGRNFKQAVEAARLETWSEPAERFIAFIETRGAKCVSPLARHARS
jgi:UDP-N-acetylglucosamine acyltransferase